MCQEVERLIFLNRKGILPQKGERPEEFFQRTADFTAAHEMKANLTRDALVLCEKLFDMQPDWVAIHERQKGLAPWQGAVLWIQEEEGRPLLPFIQISPRLRSFKKWYPLKEVIAHELLHAARLPLFSSCFEEIAAYQTSKSRWRRYLGPIMRSSSEVYIFLGALLCVWMSFIWPLFFYFTFSVPFLSVFAVMRLFFAQRTFKFCKKKLALLLDDKSKALALLVRLTDPEVHFFARSSLEKIQHYVRQKKEEQLRWQMLCLAYPFSQTYSNPSIDRH